MAEQCPQGQKWDAWKGMCVPIAGGGNTGNERIYPTNRDVGRETMMDYGLGGGLPGLGGGQPDLGAGDGGDTTDSGRGMMGCPEGYRWAPFQRDETTGKMGTCVPKEGIYLPKDERCPEGQHWEGGPFQGKCVPDDKYADDDERLKAESCGEKGGTWNWGTHECDWGTEDNLTPEEQGWHKWCINNGYPGYDKENQTCLPPNCPQGQKWDARTSKCLPICPEGSHWDAIQATCVEGEGPAIGQPDSNLDPDWWDSDIDPEGGGLPDQPGDVFADKYPILNKIIGNDPGAEKAAEDRYWKTKMTRLEEQYTKRQEQLEADLNVSGLYYSGVRADKLQELNREHGQDVMEEEAKFEYERFQREMQRNKQAMDSIFGMESLNIQYAIANGTLTLDQLQLALQEKLGIGAQDIAQQGIDLEGMNLLLQQSMAAAQTDIERQKIWQNTVILLYEMGLSEEEIQAMWAQIAGQNRTSPGG